MNAWAIFEIKGINYIILEFENNTIAKCTRWLYPCNKSWVGNVARKLKPDINFTIKELKNVNVLFEWM